MGTTTIPVSEDVKERLEHHRFDGHNSWDDVLIGMMEMLPDKTSVEDEGCINCNSNIFGDTLEESGGLVNFYRFEDRGVEYTCTNYFCSPDCFMEFQNEIDKQLPTYPDRVTIGGRKFNRCEIQSPHLICDGKSFDLTVDAPFAFMSDNSSYEGEPVYVWHEGKYRLSGVVTKIIHEFGSTTLRFAPDFAVTEQLHPDDEKQDGSVEHFCKHDYEKKECSTKGAPVYIEDERELCPLCGQSDCDVSS